VNVVATPLPGVMLLEPRVYGDARGYFVETFREAWLDQFAPGVRFVQDNHSRSTRGILRGLHYQLEHAQGKLVSVARGRIFDVAVDIRSGSPRFGQWYGVELDDLGGRMIYVPPGFAHGFLVLSDEADVIYKCTDYYHPQSERGIVWNDPSIGIAWPDCGVDVVVSAKDAANPVLRDVAAADLPPFQE
jgi:dTDP-4-dehydrorhamnose 3,5-epimerase